MHCIALHCAAHYIVASTGKTMREKNFLSFSLMKLVGLTMLELLPCFPHDKHFMHAWEIPQESLQWWCCVGCIANL